ncbi:hypothetical protein BBW65_06205 [Helicobacter enhydrae]|uniref:DUF493 domain-containing protein n=1 Tax=Helicobacter enhydrae TaxID=222136 RepID=A0A1B1U6Q6_9HELI|nr:DUF493 domain-containing protein [Helicobacter enhydrae]ANV98411.1 hypothetical protein BBW65_06205 [Helicobacter enhydrae]
MQTLEGKPQIDYPTQWEYRLIGSQREALLALIEEVIEHPSVIKDGQQSSGGKFVSVIVQTLVQDEAERDRIFMRFKQSSVVNLVL